MKKNFKCTWSKHLVRIALKIWTLGIVWCTFKKNMLKWLLTSTTSTGHSCHPSIPLSIHTQLLQKLTGTSMKLLKSWRGFPSHTLNTPHFPYKHNFDLWCKVILDCFHSIGLLRQCLHDNAVRWKRKDFVFVKQRFGTSTRLQKCEVNEGGVCNDYWIHMKLTREEWVTIIESSHFVQWNHVTFSWIRMVVFVFGCLHEENAGVFIVLV